MKNYICDMYNGGYDPYAPRSTSRYYGMIPECDFIVPSLGDDPETGVDPQESIFPVDYETGEAYNKKIHNPNSSLSGVGSSGLLLAALAVGAAFIFLKK